MVTTKQKGFQHYIRKIENDILQRFPHLTFYVEMQDEREGTIYYAPYSDEETWEITDIAASGSLDALLDHDYVIHIQPAPP